MSYKEQIREMIYNSSKTEVPVLTLVLDQS